MSQWISNTMCLLKIKAYQTTSRWSPSQIIGSIVKQWPGFKIPTALLSMKHHMSIAMASGERGNTYWHNEEHQVEDGKVDWCHVQQMRAPQRIHYCVHGLEWSCQSLGIAYQVWLYKKVIICLFQILVQYLPAAIALSKHSRVQSTNLRAVSLTLPTQYVSFISPWNPP